MYKEWYYIDWRLICGRMAQAGEAGIDQPEETEAGAAGDDSDALFSLQTPGKGALTHHTACGSRAPSEGSSPGVPLPSMDRPADANSGLCIGQSCTNALGGGHQQTAPDIYRRIACHCYQHLQMRVECR